MYVCMFNHIMYSLPIRAQVTMITAYTLAPLSLGRNYTEILIEPVYDYRKDGELSGWQ